MLKNFKNYENMRDIRYMTNIRDMLQNEELIILLYIYIYIYIYVCVCVCVCVCVWG